MSQLLDYIYSFIHWRTLSNHGPVGGGLLFFPLGFFSDGLLFFFLSGESSPDGISPGVGGDFPDEEVGDLPAELGDFFPGPSFGDLIDLVGLPEAFRDFLPELSLLLTTGCSTGGDVGGGCSCLGGDPRSDFLYLVFLIAIGIQHSMHPQRKKNTKAVALKYVPRSGLHSCVPSSKLAVYSRRSVAERIKMRTVLHIYLTD